MKPAWLILGSIALWHASPPSASAQTPQAVESERSHLKARASAIDPHVQPHPEIGFVLERDGKPQDMQHASVDTRVAPRGKLVVWLMGYQEDLFARLNGYGLHAIQVHYANQWFGTLKPKDRMARGAIRLEAATGLDVSDQITIPPPDSMTGRATRFVAWLAKEHPDGHWDQFLSHDGQSLHWEKVIISGASHGATTAARFAQHTRVDRVVMLCGPRDQDQDWQSLPSATPTERFFGFTHALDTGWTGNHYCRSWEMLGLHNFGPITNVESNPPPYHHSRRLLSTAEVQGDAKRAHSAVTPGPASPKSPDGSFLYEPVWHYLFNHPVDQVGSPSEPDPLCEKNHPLGR